MPVLVVRRVTDDGRQSANLVILNARGYDISVDEMSQGWMFWAADGSDWTKSYNFYGHNNSTGAEIHGKIGGSVVQYGIGVDLRCSVDFIYKFTNAEGVETMPTDGWGIRIYYPGRQHIFSPTRE